MNQRIYCYCYCREGNSAFLHDHEHATPTLPAIHSLGTASIKKTNLAK
jgi:hypothetical protein